MGKLLIFEDTSGVDSGGGTIRLNIIHYLDTHCQEGMQILDTY